MIYLLLFIIGSVIGSFLNVCIYRFPRHQKIGLSRSHCPHCGEIIRWYDNIPLISYILLRGKCRHCGRHISFRYFIVELLTAFMLSSLWLQFGSTGLVLIAIYGIFISLLIAASFIDLEFFTIPDSISLLGIIFGLAASSFYPLLMKAHIWYYGLFRSFIGVLAGAGSLYIIGIIATAILKKEAMGMGDVKLLGMIGSFLGCPWVFFTIFCSSLLGTIVGIVLIAMKKTDIRGRIPFGPYLAMGAVISIFFGKAIINWYINLF